MEASKDIPKILAYQAIVLSFLGIVYLVSTEVDHSVLTVITNAVLDCL